MLVCSLVFLMIALLMALLDLGGGDGIGTSSAEACFAISAALFVVSAVRQLWRHQAPPGGDADPPAS